MLNVPTQCVVVPAPPTQHLSPRETRAPVSTLNNHLSALPPPISLFNTGSLWRTLSGEHCLHIYFNDLASVTLWFAPAKHQPSPRRVTETAQEMGLHAYLPIIFMTSLCQFTFNFLLKVLST